MLVLFVASCAAKKTGYNAAGTVVQGADTTTNTNTPENKSKINIQTPMTLSNTEFTFNGQLAYMRLKMVKGRYYEDWNPGAYMGTNWEGQFVIDLADELGNNIAETDISKIFSEPLTFNSTFSIELDDYNDDGDLDFTIGQYGSSNGYLYRIFTLRKDGKVEQLTIKDHTDLFISNRTGNYSTKLNKIKGAAFEIEYYDNSVTAAFHDLYQWDGMQFVLAM
jgi:bla regulator protein BlaR1